jgi:hypothetical protein
MKTDGKHEVVARVTRRGLMLAAVLAMALFTADLSRAQSTSGSFTAPAKGVAQAASPASATTKTADNPAAEKPSSSGMNTAIKMHARWTIDVLNSDGTLSKHVEFENSLSLIGAEALPNILGRTMTAGAWAIGLGFSGISVRTDAPKGPGPCSGSASDSLFAPKPSPLGTWFDEPVNGSCFIAEPIVGSGGTGQPGYSAACDLGNFCFPNLTVSVISVPGAGIFVTTEKGSTGPTTNALNLLQLQGTATAQNDGAIDTVATFLMLCASPAGPSTVSPSSCMNTTTAASNANFATITGINTLGQGSPSFGNSITGTFLNGTSPTSTPPSAVTVLATQMLRVTVLISFS